MYGSYLLPEAKAVSTDALFKCYMYILGYILVITVIQTTRQLAAYVLQCCEGCIFTLWSLGFNVDFEF